MNPSDTAAKVLQRSVMTVLGPIDSADLGFTLPHEHLIIDCSVYFKEPDDPAARDRAHAPVSLENLSWVRYNFRDSLDCQQLLDDEVAVCEVERFRRAGGRSIVEMSTRSIGRAPLILARISRATGVHIVMGSGHYIAGSHGRDIETRTESEIAEEIISELQRGVDETGVRSGIIGEIGCSWPMRDSEIKVLRASALAQQQTGAAINIHPSRNEKGPLEAMNILRDSGARLDKVVMSHMDRCGYLLETRRRLLDAGMYIEYDVFGKEGYYPWQAAMADEHLPDMPNDVGRIKEIAELIEMGYLSQVLISHDICLKIDLTRYGGHGYSHIIENVIPYMQVYGYTADQIHTLTVKNPQRMLEVEKG